MGGRGLKEVQDVIDTGIQSARGLIRGEIYESQDVDAESLGMDVCNERTTAC